MNKLKILYLIIAILFGIFMIVYGEKDDSPGAQFLGLIIIIASIFSFHKSKNKKSGLSIKKKLYIT